MRIRFTKVILVAACVGLPWAAAPTAKAQGAGGSTGTPAEIVATYGSLADGILALKRTEEELCRSILAAARAHGQVELQRAKKALSGGDSSAAQAAVESLAAIVGNMATEGDSAVGAVRKRLLDGGHHHNAAGEAQGLFDEGYVIVTRAAKAKLLESSRALGQMSRSAKADAVEAEWKKVDAVVSGLLAAK
ncbi:MAG TPA: hypothetical protein VIC87_02410 [Vicinamibacteria bacterium]|jgi:hypothetical protein